METEEESAVRTAAIEWHMRLRHGGDAVWEGFEVWLTQSPAHAQAYDEIEELDTAIQPFLADLRFDTAANDSAETALNMPMRRRWWALAGGALAASIAAVVAITPLLRDSRYEVATRQGENQIVTLDGGTRITLNGGTRMIFDHDDPRYAMLASGEALFHVRHDSARPFQLHVGDRIVEDAGTIFNVAHEGGELRVEVAEGKVVYDPGKKPTLLNVGQGLIVRDDAARLIDVPVAAVGGWQQGQLIYRGEPLSRVASDLSRATGLRIRVAADIAARPVHGTISFEGTGQELLARLGTALQVRFQPDGDGWIVRADVP
ncbi:MAG TPA: FecR domain-containing protein [Sphingobium sp.]|uniref:FecR family protein n=1 Tax=Sphingobium sp. TaxID=1912891 RepID=UPI002ED1E35A